MKILYVASEVAPFMKTGGLADVAGALPKVLAKDHDIRVIMPLYSKISSEFKSKMKFEKYFYVNVAWRRKYCGLFSLEHEGTIYYFIDNEDYFKRDTIYGYDDDIERFAFFAKAVIDTLKEIDFCPDIVNVNDWQTALIPIYLKLLYHSDEFYERIKTVLTIHNIEYQGRHGKYVMQDILGISDGEFDNGFLELNGDVNLLKGAILCADAINTVSETYANEIKTDFYGHGLQYVLRENDHKLFGIVNGLDIELYDPKTNKHLFNNYDLNSIKVKDENKKELLRCMCLDYKEGTPVISIISRFVSHKGLDLVENVLEEILSEDVKLIVLGTGDFKYEQMFEDMKRRYPSKISVNIAFSEDLANKIYSGSDIFLMPSVSEPCGLSQMISMRYGTLPVVRETGGLADTVKSYSEDIKEGDGFTFKNINAHDMLYTVKKACDIYKNEKKTWNTLVKRAMKKDFSWDKSASEYVSIYNKICQS